MKAYCSDAYTTVLFACCNNSIAQAKELINAVGYCRAQTDIFFLWEKLSVSLAEPVLYETDSDLWEYYSRVMNPLWKPIFGSVRISVKTHWIFLYLWEKIKNNFSILHFCFWVVNIISFYGAYPLLRCRPLGLACHQYLLLPVFFASQPTQTKRSSSIHA